MIWNYRPYFLKKIYINMMGNSEKHPPNLHAPLGDNVFHLYQQKIMSEMLLLKEINNSDDNNENNEEEISTLESILYKINE